MKKPGCQLAVLLALLLCGTTLRAEGVNRFQLESTAVQCLYDIEVVVPTAPPADATNYPVAYCMDWFMLADYLKALPRLLALGHLTEPYILVGITQGVTSADWAAMRTRDYTPAYPTDEYSISTIYAPALESCGGAGRFTAFLKSELIPLIEAEYPADSTRRCFVGYSFGGLYGVHLLTEEPELFQDYLLGSSSLWFNDYYLAAALEELTAERLAVIGRVYLSVGEEESWEMLKSYDILRSAFQQTGFEAPRLKVEIIPDAGHVGAMPISLYNGFRFLFQSE